MSIDITVKFEGGKELERAFTELPKALGKSALRSAQRKALKPVLAAAKARVPKRTGNLAKSLKILAKVKSSQKRYVNEKKGDVISYLGASWPMGAHAHLIEFGHEIKPRGRDKRERERTHSSAGLRNAKEGGDAGRARAYPFLRPAWDENKMKVLDDMRAIMWNELAKRARKLAGKAAAGTLSAREISELSE